MNKVARNFPKIRLLKGFQLNEEITILMIFLFIFIVVSIIVPQFRTIYNFLSVFRQFSLISIVAMGETLVLISGGFDLSVGSIAALSGMFTAHMMVTFNWPIWLSVIIGMSIGGFCGLLNGLLVGKVKINPLIATLASGWIFNGIILITTKGWPVAELPKPFYFLGQGYLLGIPFPIIIMLVIGVILSVFLSKTVYGRNIYAVGGNERASILSGLNVDNVKIMVFVMCGLFAGFAGIVLSSRMGSAQATGGTQWPLPAIAAAVIGGFSLSGGKGKIYGVIIGSALLGIINNILVLLHVSPYWQSLISGFILIGAVAIDTIRKGR